MVSGELEEQRWIATERGLRTRRIRAGRGATFDLGHVHDVVNTAPRHAVSVHAYSPPLTARLTRMGLYHGVPVSHSMSLSYVNSSPSGLKSMSYVLRSPAHRS